MKDFWKNLYLREKSLILYLLNKDFWALWVVLGIVTPSLEIQRGHFKNFLSGSRFAVDSVDGCTPQHSAPVPTIAHPGLATVLSHYQICFFCSNGAILLCKVDESGNFCLAQESLEPNS